MKKFPLEPLRRVRDLRLEAQQRLVSERRVDLDRAEQRRDFAMQSRTNVIEKRQRHQYASEVAMSQPDTLAIEWLERAERYRVWIDHEIVKSDAVLAVAQEEVVKAQAKLSEEIAVLRRVQAKVDALQTFRGEWVRGQQREQERREERDGEELFRMPDAATR